MRTVKSKYNLSASQEDYLEAIYHITHEKLAAKPKDVANYLKVRASSVTTALRALAAAGLINYAPYDLVTLTARGRNAAKDIVYRHNALQHFLVGVLGVEEGEADTAACMMEHSVPKAIVERLIKYSEYIKKCPKGGITWDSGFGYYCKQDNPPEGCALCVPQQDVVQTSESSPVAGGVAPTRKSRTKK